MERKATQRLRRLQWLPVFLCAMAIAINYIDRSTIAIGIPQIREEFGLSATELGALVSVWSLCFAFSQLPLGWLVDRVGARPLLGCALLVWSLAQAAGGMVSGFGQLLWTRGILGIGEAPAYSTSARVVSNWFHMDKRGLPTGIYNMAGSLAPALAPPLLTVLMLAFGWRVMFIAMGAIGVIGAVVWFIFYRDPEQCSLSSDEIKQLRSGDTGHTSGVSLAQWGRLFTFRTTWGMILGSFCLSYVLWMFQTWLPAYLEMQHHLSIARTGMYAAIPYIFGIAGSVMSGYFSDLIAKKGMPVVKSRKLPAVIGLIAIAIFTLLTSRSTSVFSALAFISCTMFFIQMAAAGVWIIPSSVAPHNYVASCASIQNFGGYLGATISPLVTGMIVDITGSFNLALAIAAAVALVGSCFYWFGVRQPIKASVIEATTQAG